jgi:cell division septation protein DedD
MDRQLLERMIGAGVLLVVLVLIAPAILDGQRDNGIASYSDNGPDDRASVTGIPLPAAPAPQLRTHTIVLDREPGGPPVARPVDAPSVVAEPETVVKTGEPVAKPAAKPDVVAAPAKSAQATVAVKTAKKEVKPKPVEVPASGWSVQLGSFTERPNAERLAGEVTSRGFTAYLEPLKQSGKTYYRVRVGPRNTRDQAAELAGGLSKAGYTGQVIQQQPAP